MMSEPSKAQHTSNHSLSCTEHPGQCEIHGETLSQQEKGNQLQNIKNKISVTTMYYLHINFPLLKLTDVQTNKMFPIQMFVVGTKCPFQDTNTSKSL